MEPLARPSKSTTHLTPESQMRQQRAVIINVREPDEFAREHIAGAVSLPLLETKPERLPTGKTVVLDRGAGKRSCIAGERLAESGYRDVAVVEGTSERELIEDARAHL